MTSERCPNCEAELTNGLCPLCLVRLGIEAPLPARGVAGETLDLPPAPGSVLDTVFGPSGVVPRVLLRDTGAGEEPSPITRPASGGSLSSRYRIDGEIARGGMGAVLRGRDPDLGRDVAIKVLREDHRDNPDMVRRFVEEAQISGQLQHPGITPIYELAVFGDNRPFFSMKLVKGDTLAKLLEARKGPGDDLPRFLGIFGSIAQTVAYAHARGVIHRDLKPSNVMVGSFGEVQVMDWGLAKVLPRGGVADDATAGKHDPQESVIATARSGADDSDLSRAGSVLGTPSYMAPEQARGEIERVDERADVFALGSILCEILTGQPAFIGRTSGEIQRRAARGDLGEALARLDARAADAGLVALVRECLAPEPEGRPRHAGAVAGRIVAYLASIEHRLHEAELDRAASSARAEEAVRTAEVARARARAERRARRLQLGLAAVVLAVTTVGGLGTTAWLQQRSNRLARVDVALKEAELLAKQAADDATGDPGKWQEARLALRRSADLLAETKDEEAAARVAALGRRIDAGEERARSDRRLIDRLEAVQFRREPSLGEAGPAGEHAGEQAEADYAALFGEAGLDPDRLEPAGWVRRLAGRPANLVGAIVAALDDWATVRRRAAGAASPGTRRLLDAVRAIDPDPWRDGLRAAMAAGDREGLVRLARDPKLTDQPPASLILLTLELTAIGQEGLAIESLRRAQRRYPDNFPISQSLSWALVERGGKEDREEGLRFATAAVALNPRAGMTRATLGRALAFKGQYEAAEREFREAIRLQPDYPNIYTHYGIMLYTAKRIEEAVVLHREAVRLKPDWKAARTALANCLMALGRVEEASSELREVIRRDPDDANVHFSLGNLLKGQDRLDEAVASYREAVRVDFRTGHIGHAAFALASTLKELGRGDETTMLIEPGTPGQWADRGQWMASVGRWREARADMDRALELKLDSEAILFRAATIDLWLGDVEGYRRHCVAMLDRFEASTDPRVAEHVVRIGLLDPRTHDGRARAERVAERAVAANPPAWLLAWFDASRALAAYRAGRPAEAIQRARSIPGGGVPEILASLVIAMASHREGRAVEARLWLDLARRSIAAQIPALDDLPYGNNWHDILQAHLRLREADRLIRGETGPSPVPAADPTTLEGVRLREELSQGYFRLAATLQNQGKTDEAFAARREAIRLKPVDASALYTLGLVLDSQGKTDEATTAIRQGLTASFADLVAVLGERETLVTIANATRKAVEQEPDDPGLRHRLALAQVRSGDREGYRRTLASTIERLGRSEDAWIAEAARACLLAPEAGDDLSVPRRLAEFAARRVPRSPWMQYVLGLAYLRTGEFDRAIQSLEQSIKVDGGWTGSPLNWPALAMAHHRLGHEREARAWLEKARTARGDRARAIVPAAMDHPHDREEFQILLRQAEELIVGKTTDPAARLRAVLRGEESAGDAGETAGLAHAASDVARYAASARFFAEAFAADPDLAEVPRAGNRYKAACAAALAAAGRGRDEPPPDDPARSKLRRQALDWLKAELESRRKPLDSGPPESRPGIIEYLKRWRQDGDLATLREPEALAKLPEAERDDWQALWEEVQALLQRAQGPKP